MASLLKDPLFEISGNGPAPDKTFYALTVTKSEVFWGWWKITLRRNVDRRPGKIKESHLDLLEDTRLQREIALVFGEDVLNYTKSLCQGQFNYLEHLPDALLLHILSFLELEDVGQLLRTSRRFWKLCQSEEYWEKAVRQQCSTLPDEVVTLARNIGWRRIFFTNKLQLQLLINRHQVKLPEAQEEEAEDENPPSETPAEDKSSDPKDEKSESSVTPPEQMSIDSLSPVLSLDSADSYSSFYSDTFSSSGDKLKSSPEDVLEDLEKFSLDQGEKAEMKSEDLPMSLKI
ncbi:F-box only protein 36b [Boleophthalmus pectinirostris]|uniref:F-box only protein 36b n=1 Tax=Boleophthalmus pectinirostris TaxID=150288 RepID=UPI000A1C4D80|nr:F-box only protein 36b [Boleophthalmus pectinirostris]